MGKVGAELRDEPHMYCVVEARSACTRLSVVLARKQLFLSLLPALALCGSL